MKCPSSMEYIVDPTVVYKDPAFKGARKNIAGVLRNIPEEHWKKDGEEDRKIALLRNARSSHIRFALLNGNRSEEGEKDGIVEISVMAQFSNILNRPLAPHEIRNMPQLADEPVEKTIDPDWSSELLRELSEREIVAALCAAYSNRAKRLVRELERGGFGNRDIQRRLALMEERCAAAIERLLPKPPEEIRLPWPPEGPPNKEDIDDAWDMMADVARELVKEAHPDHETRAFVDSLGADSFFVSLMTYEEKTEEIMDAITPQEDARPTFAPDDEHGEGNDDDDTTWNDDHGDVAMQEPVYDENTEFFISMKFERKWNKESEKWPTILSNRSQTVFIPDITAMNVIAALPPEARKTIADALLFKLLEKIINEEAEDEEEDGGVHPAWRTTFREGTADILENCVKLQDLYIRLVTIGVTPDDVM